MTGRRARLVRRTIESARERQQIEANRAIVEQWRRKAALSEALLADYRRCLSVFPGDFLGPVMRCTLDAPHTGLPHDADGMVWSDPEPRRIWWKPRTW